MINKIEGFKPFQRQNPISSLNAQVPEKQKLLKKMTIDLLNTFKRINDNYGYDVSMNPKRILTFPSEGVYNDGYDNENHDYIMRIDDVLICKTETTYKEFVILDLLGQGTFGQVVKCQSLQTSQLVAIKIIKNLPSYYRQGKLEIRILRKLNKIESPYIPTKKDGKMDSPSSKFFNRNYKGSEKEKNEKLSFGNDETSFNCKSSLPSKKNCKHHNNNGNDCCNSHNSPKIVKLYEYFLFRNHLCIVIELLDASLYELLNITEFKGIALSDVALYSRQILEGLIRMEREGIVHCDLKPENILFVENSSISSELRIIDFGSACFQNHPIFVYIQSRHYRSPEVLIEAEYGLPIDIWSFGCIVAELFLGLPIFPGNSDYDQMRRIIQILGYPNVDFIARGNNWKKFFKEKDGIYELKTKEEYEKDEGKKIDNPKTYFILEKLDDLINYYPKSIYRQQEESANEKENFAIFLDFLKSLLVIDPCERISASVAYMHPFIQMHNRLAEKIDVQLPFFKNHILRLFLAKMPILKKKEIYYKNIRKKFLPNQTNEGVGNKIYNNVFKEKSLFKRKSNKGDFKVAFKRKKMRENMGNSKNYENSYNRNDYAENYKNYANQWNCQFNYNLPVSNPLMNYHNYINNYLLYPYWNYENSVIFPNDLYLRFNNMNLEGGHGLEDKKYFRKTNQSYSHSHCTEENEKKSDGRK